MITAHEALTKLTEEDAAQLIMAEARIDAALRNYNGQREVVDVTASPRVIAKLVSMYDAAGWTVKVQHGDQREPGPYLIFTTPGKTPQ